MSDNITNIFMDDHEGDSKQFSSDNIEEMFDNISGISPFEKEESANDVDSALGLLRRTSINNDNDSDDSIEYLKKQLDNITS